MGANKSIRIGICVLAMIAALLAGAKSARAQTASPIRYVFGPNSFTDSKGQLWSAIPQSDLSGSASHHWSICTPTAVFTGTPDPGLYREQMVEDSGDLVMTIPVSSGAYTVNLYFAEPCSNTVAGSRVFGVTVNGTTIVPRLDLTATAGVEKPVIESTQISGTQVSLDLKRIADAPLIAGIEVLPASPSSSSGSASSSFQVAAKLGWEDGTPVAGTVNVTQLISTNPAASKVARKFYAGCEWSGHGPPDCGPHVAPDLFVYARRTHRRNREHAIVFLRPDHAQGISSRAERINRPEQSERDAEVFFVLTYSRSRRANEK